MPSPHPDPDPEPVQQPVAFRDADVAAADELIDRFGSLAAAVVPQAPSEERQLARLLQVARAANHTLAADLASGGLKVAELVRQAHYASDTHVRESLRGTWTRNWGAAAIRLLLASTTPVLAEEIESHASRVSRESRFIAADGLKGAANVKQILDIQLAAIDRVFVAAQYPLVTDTYWDRDSDRADESAIRRAQAALGEPLATGIAEHLAALLGERRVLRAMFNDARAAHGERFREAGLDPDTVLGRAFSDLLILRPLPHGAPRVKFESFSRQLMPGDQPEIVTTVRSAGVIGIAACDPPRDASAGRAPSRTVTIPRLLSSQWGLTGSPWDVTFTAIGDDLLLRESNTGAGVEVSLWRTFGLSNTDPLAAVLAQRAAEPWASRCIHRARSLAPVGRFNAKDPAFRLAIRAFVSVADAARVTAERTRRAGPA